VIVEKREPRRGLLPLATPRVEQRGRIAIGDGFNSDIAPEELVTASVERDRGGTLTRDEVPDLVGDRPPRCRRGQRPLRMIERAQQFVENGVLIAEIGEK
jgi:hypothetical protein